MNFLKSKTNTSDNNSIVIPRVTVCDGGCLNTCSGQCYTGCNYTCQTGCKGSCIVGCAVDMCAS